MRLLFILFSIFLANLSFAQCNSDTSYIHKVYELDSIPVYEGDLLSALAKEVKYNEKMGCVNGTVYVSLIINKDGILESANIKKSVSQEVDKEALRAIKHLPGIWKPGKCKKAVVKSELVIPIRFKMG